jgi:hypothetical protein
LYSIVVYYFLVFWLRFFIQMIQITVSDDFSKKIIDCEIKGESLKDFFFLLKYIQLRFFVTSIKRKNIYFLRKILKICIVYFFFINLWNGTRILGLGLWCLTSLSTIFQLYRGVPGENHRPAASHWQILSHNVVSSTPCQSRIQTHKDSGDRHLWHR